MTAPLTWLNGWHRLGLRDVLTGTEVRCAGCGQSHGIITIAISEGQTWPTVDPAWPFPEDDCPVHQPRVIPPPLTAAERIASRGPLP